MYCDIACHLYCSYPQVLELEFNETVVFLCLLLCLILCLIFCLFFCLFLYFFFCLFLYFFFCLFFCLFLCLFFCLFLCFFLCLSLCLCFRFVSLYFPCRTSEDFTFNVASIFMVLNLQDSALEFTEKRSSLYLSLSLFP